MHGIWLLLFVSVLGSVLELIPTASLAAVLVYTGYKLVNPKVIKTLWGYGKGEVVVYAATVGTIVATDLLTGILVGVGLSVAKLVYTFSHLKVRVQTDEKANRAVLDLEGAATFLRLPRLAAALESVPANAELHVHFERLGYIDHACLELLMSWSKQHESTGGRLVIDWDSLRGRFSRGNGKNGAGAGHSRAANGRVSGAESGDGQPAAMPAG
jgi:MFS superfamily sulfate permease-like transporter